MGVLDNLGINLGYIIIQALGFGIIFLVVRGYAYDPILRLLDERKAKIAKGLEDARQASIARENADAEAKKILDAARAEAAKVRSDANVQAEEIAAGVRSNANEEARSIVNAARTDAEAERNTILSELRGQVAAVAMAAANKIVGEAMDEQRQRAIIADFFAKVPTTVSGLIGDTAVVTSALPLTDDEQSNIKATLKVGSVNFRVDPRILGGLVIRVGDQVIDNSVANQMDAMRDALA